MSRPMNMQQVAELISHAQKKHPPNLTRLARKRKKLVGRGVNFILPVYDMKGENVAVVKVMGPYERKEFNVSDGEPSTDSLFDVIMAWMDTEEE